MGRSLLHLLSVSSVCQGQTGTASTAAAMISIIRRVLFGTSVGVGLALFGAPAVVSALGFKAGGIAAGSIAAKMMSAAAIANNGGVAAGSIVAVLQSIGAAGFAANAKFLLSSILGTLCGIIGAKCF